MSDANNAQRSDKRKQSLYFPETMLTEIKDEAARLVIDGTARLRAMG